ncbi:MULTISPECIES: hypothetical protein [Pseudomonas]|uniref:hypothetical protein n=1 Tax=Pseudomonas TaxID=286 RepID=UPI000CD5B3B4|nr:MULTISPECIES: hypothetical protein [Pseudomonas]RBH53173.1 hypothetical protein C3F00_028715 [Pseudomonas sp. MWU13-2860]
MNRLFIAVLFVGVALVGCAFTDAHRVVAQSAATLVGTYCKAPMPARAVLRQQIAADTAPNKIRVECAADAL